MGRNRCEKLTKKSWKVDKPTAVPRGIFLVDKMQCRKTSPRCILCVLEVFAAILLKSPLTTELWGRLQKTFFCEKLYTQCDFIIISRNCEFFPKARVTERLASHENYQKLLETVSCLWDSRKWNSRKPKIFLAAEGVFWALFAKIMFFPIPANFWNFGPQDLRHRGASPIKLA